MNSYSQFGEDTWIYRNLPLPPKGIFCEVGAYDGVASSNTKAFEDEGWSGICIEPDPEIAGLCRQHRRCLTLQCAVDEWNANSLFYVNKADRGQSRLAKPGEKVGGIEVLTLPLVSILSPIGVPIDLLSIDTEGTEMAVWASLREFNRPRIVVMEFLTWGSPPRDKEIVERMAKSGYKEVHRTEANLIFVKQ